MKLKDLKGPISAYMLNSYARSFLEALHGEAINERGRVEQGRSTPELAAMNLHALGMGLIRGSDIMGLETDLRAELDRIIHEIDPDFAAHMHARWAARPAGLALMNTPGPSIEEKAGETADNLLRQLRSPPSP